MITIFLETPPREITAWERWHITESILIMSAFTALAGAIYARRRQFQAILEELDA